MGFPELSRGTRSPASGVSARNECRSDRLGSVGQRALPAFERRRRTVCWQSTQSWSSPPTAGIRCCADARDCLRSSSARRSTSFGCASRALRTTRPSCSDTLPPDASWSRSTAAPTTSADTSSAKIATMRFARPAWRRCAKGWPRRCRSSPTALASSGAGTTSNYSRSRSTASATGIARGSYASAMRPTRCRRSVASALILRSRMRSPRPTVWRFRYAVAPFPPATWRAYKRGASFRRG